MKPDTAKGFSEISSSIVNGDKSALDNTTGHGTPDKVEVKNIVEEGDMKEVGEEEGMKEVLPDRYKPKAPIRRDFDALNQSQQPDSSDVIRTFSPATPGRYLPHLLSRLVTSSPGGKWRRDADTHAEALFQMVKNSFQGGPVITFNISKSNEKVTK